MKVERIDHIVLTVKDLEATARFFSDLMGSEVYEPMEIMGMKISFDSLGLEIMEPLQGGNPVAEQVEKYGEGIAWLALKVPDLEEAVAELKEKGYSVEYWTPPDYKGDLKAARISNPDRMYGIGIELVEYSEVRPTALAMRDKMGQVPRMSRI